MPLSLTPVYWLLLQGTWTMARSGARSARRKRLCPTWACSVHPLTLSSKHGSSALEASEKDAYYWGVGEVEVCSSTLNPSPPLVVDQVYAPFGSQTHHNFLPRTTCCELQRIEPRHTNTHTHTHTCTHTHTILSLNVYRAHIRTGCY